MHELEVLHPAAWVLIPESATIITDPDLDDSSPRWPKPFRGSWRAIGQAVRDAVVAAQRRTPDPFLATITVPLNIELSAPELFVVEEWLLGGLEIDAESGEVTDGRHRLWNVKAGGLSEVPATLSAIGDAVKFYIRDDADQLMGYPTKETLLLWEESLEWWRSPDASAWREINPDHESRFREVMSAWSRRLS